MEKAGNYIPIENYGIIGDLHTVALVSNTGSIDFMCFTRFDSPTIFGAMLDAGKGGYFSIQPQLKNQVCKQLYLPDTAILLSRFLSDDGIAELTDFMPVNRKEYNCAVLRKITTVRGAITYKMHCKPRFNYGQTTHTVTAEKQILVFTANSDAQSSFRLLSDVKLQSNGTDGYAEFTLNEGESAYFILQAIPSDFAPETPDVLFNRTYNNTIQFWQNWVEQSCYKGRWREMVNRSAITLKLMTSYEYGSVIAAPTFGLPETIGGIRNWDYRYTWIRDAAFTMYAFLRLGFTNEAGAFIDWVQQRCVQGELQLMYAVDGKMNLKEYELPQWEGYMASSPVRVGNGAHSQFQLDINGELIDTVYLYNKHGGAITYEFWQELQKIVEFVVDNWQKPDHGIWEMRREKLEFLHSRMMCWVAMDRAIKIADNRSFPYDMARWHKVRNEIYTDIYYNFWSEEKQAFVQYKGAQAVDASALLIPLVRFLSPVEERWQKTLQAIERELKTDVLIYRYKNALEHVDGLKGDEGTFCMCSFWYVECLAKSGQVEKARENFQKMLGYANHLGLFSEQIGLHGQYLGNFPQAFTHLALISAALELDRDIK